MERYQQDSNQENIEYQKPIKLDDIGTLPNVVQDMIDTMRAANGVGLAAPQIGLNIRLIVFEIPASRQTASDRETPIGPQVLINPKIVQFSEEVELEWEGCLSIPGLTGAVPRHHRIVYRGYLPSGEEVEREATNFHARVVQHEIDHLDGVLFPIRMNDLSTLSFNEELKNFMDRSEPNSENEEGDTC